MGSDYWPEAPLPRRDDFNPRSPCGERPGSNDAPYGDNQFQSTLPVWGATDSDNPQLIVRFISIHAPRVGSDRTGFLCLIALLDFNPRSPCGERPDCGMDEALRDFDFNPRSPCGERPQYLARESISFYFNPRSPCGERRLTPMFIKALPLFQSTLPVWGATLLQEMGNPVVKDFNPRSPCGERRKRFLKRIWLS